MIPLRILGATHLFKAPACMPDARDLHCRVEEGCVFSRWEPTPEELALLVLGGSAAAWSWRWWAASLRSA